MAAKVRTCRTAAEYKAALGAISEYGTWEPTDKELKRFQRYLPLDRMHAAFEGRNVLGGAGAFEYEVSVPGGSVACAGVTVVGVYPPHIRRGVLTAMMRAQSTTRTSAATRSRCSGHPTSGSTDGTATGSHRSSARSSCRGSAPASLHRTKTRGTISYVDLEKGRAGC